MTVRTRRYVPRIGTEFREGQLQKKMMAGGWRKRSASVHTVAGVITVEWKAGNNTVFITVRQSVPTKASLRKGRYPLSHYWKVTNIQRIKE